MTARTRFGLAAALAGVYAVCYPLIKLGLAYAPPLGFAALRALLAGAVLLALLAVLRRPVVPPRRLWPGVAALALMSGASASRSSWPPPSASCSASCCSANGRRRSHGSASP